MFIFFFFFFFFLNLTSTTTKTIKPIQKLGFDNRPKVCYSLGVGIGHHVRKHLEAKAAAKVKREKALRSAYESLSAADHSSPVRSEDRNTPVPVRPESPIPKTICETCKGLHVIRPYRFMGQVRIEVCGSCKGKLYLLRASWLHTKGYEPQGIIVVDFLKNHYRLHPKS